MYALEVSNLCFYFLKNHIIQISIKLINSVLETPITKENKQAPKIFRILP